PTIRVHHCNELIFLWKGSEILFELDGIVARRELRGEAGFHAEYLGVSDQIGDVSRHPLVMGNKEAVAVYLFGSGPDSISGVEPIGFAVEPGPLGLIGIDLAFQRYAVGERPLEARPEPKLPGAGEVVEDIVIGLEGTGVDGHRPKVMR